MSVCWACDGVGGWEDAVLQQSLLCPVCHPTLRTVVKPPWPDICGKRPQPHIGPKYAAKPWLLVIHSGSTGGNVAGFLADIGFHRKANGQKGYVSAHFAFDNDVGDYVQGVPLTHVAWHCGGSVLYQDRLIACGVDAGCDETRPNFISYGIEMRGPAGRRYSASEHQAIVRIATELKKRVPTLRVVTRHQDIKSNKRDPGRQFDLTCLEPIGFSAYQ